MDWAVIAVVLSMAVVIERLLEAIGEPIIGIVAGAGGVVSPDVKRLVYLVLGSAVGWTLGANAFPAFGRYPIVGEIVTALLVGAGSQVIHAIIEALQAEDVAR